MRIKMNYFIVATVIWGMVANCAYAVDTTTKFNTGPYTVKFDLGELSNNSTAKPIHQEVLSGPQDVYFATASNNTIYFILMHLNETNFDVVPYLGAEGLSRNLANLGVSQDSIAIYSCLINKKPGVVGSGYIPASNSNEYQAWFSISNNDFGIVGTRNETKLKSILKTINVTTKKPKAPICQPFEFGIKGLLDASGQFCTDGLLILDASVFGVEYTRSELDLSKGKRCQSVNAGNFGSATCCFDLDKKDYCLKITAWTNSATGKTSKMKEKTICMQPKLDELLEKLG